MDICGNSNCKKNLKQARFRRNRICLQCKKRFCSKCFTSIQSASLRKTVRGYCYECYINLNPDQLDYGKYFGESIPSEKTLKKNLTKYTKSIQKDPFTVFKSIKILGKGSTSTVYKVMSQSGELFALKVIDRNANPQEIQLEYLISCMIKSENLLKSYSIYKNDEAFSILIEYSDHSLHSLLPLMRGQNENFHGYIIKEILKGLEVLHRDYVIHRDLKCENIFVNKKGEVKIGDFGLSAQLVRERDVRETGAGSPCWEAPEVLGGKKYNRSCDIWSFGITCIELVTGNPPNIDCKSMLSLMIKLQNGPEPRLGSEFSSLFQNFIENCLQKNPEARKSVIELLNHPFISSVDCKKGLQDLQLLISSSFADPPT